MKKLFAIVIAGLFSSLAFAQTFPSPTFNSLTLQNPLPVSSGGTGASSSTGSGSLVLSTAPTVSNPTVTGAFTATGLVKTTDLATQAANTILANATSSAASPTAFSVPSCSTSSSALGWTSGTGFVCNTGINASTLGGATFAAPGSIGSGTPGSAAFTTLSTTSAPTVGATTIYPTVATNTALVALSTVTVSTVTRLGFTAAGDAPPLTYTASASACSLNSGAGDNGSQVQSANGKCWLADFPPGPIDAREFGADPTGTNDSTSALQADANIGRPIYIRGSFKFSTLTMSAGGIVGDGQAYSFLNSTDTTSANVITFSAVNIQPGTAAPVFRNFTLQGQSGKTSGAGILVTAPSSENQGARFTNVTVYTFPVCIQFGAASNWTIQNSAIINYLNTGISIADTNNPDSGDSTIMGSFIGTAVGTTPVGVGYLSSGGLKFIGNKINGGAYGFFLGLNAPSSTSILLIDGNSIENQTVAAIELSRSSGTATFSKITILGNELGINQNGIVADASGAISDLSITGNAIDLTSTTTGACISLGSVATFAISNNTCIGNGGTPTGISIASGSSNGKVGANTYKNLTNTLSNLSATTFYARDRQIISVNVSTSTAYGSLFVGSAAETFSPAFTVAPSVVCTPTSAGAGAISAIPASVSASGFTLNVIGLNNSSSIAVTCEADGVI